MDLEANLPGTSNLLVCTAAEAEGHDRAFLATSPADSSLEVVDEIGHDLRAQAFERLEPAIFLRVKFGMALHDPAEIAGPGRP